MTEEIGAGLMRETKTTVRILMLTLTFYFLFSFQTDTDFGKIVILKEYLRMFLHYYFQN